MDKSTENPTENLNLTPLKEMASKETDEENREEESTEMTEETAEEENMRQLQEQVNQRRDAEGQMMAKARLAQGRAQTAGIQGVIAKKAKSKVGKALIAGAMGSAAAGGGISLWSLFS